MPLIKYGDFKLLKFTGVEQLVSGEQSLGHCHQDPLRRLGLPVEFIFIENTHQTTGQTCWHFGELKS